MYFPVFFLLSDIDSTFWAVKFTSKFFLNIIKLNVIVPANILAQLSLNWYLMNVWETLFIYFIIHSNYSCIIAKCPTYVMV